MSFNLDKVKEEKTSIMNSLGEAIRNNDEEGMKNALSNWSKCVHDSIIEEATAITDSTDVSILKSRGVRMLTSAENKYYTGMIEHVKNVGTIAGYDEILPETVFNDVFDDMQSSSELLRYINFVNTNAVTKWVINDEPQQMASWGALNTEITEELEGAVKVISIIQNKLTAYMLLSNDMIDLGAAWLDRYVRETLKGAVLVALECGFVDGDGKNCPVGMTRNVSDDVTVTGGVYPRKAALAINSLDVATYGSVVQKLTESRTGRKRRVSNLIAICNPADYYSKILPATTILTPGGVYVNDVLPIKTTIVQSIGVPEGKMIVGMADKYFAGVSLGRNPKIEYSDDFKFLEDVRTFKIKMYANGRANDNNSFVYLDITGLGSVYPTVETKQYADTRLASLTLGTVELSPKFDKHTNFYTATTTSATNTVTATAIDNSANVVIKNGNTTVTSGQSATWDTGENVLTVAVTNGGDTRTYTVIVTKE